jgi:hypothetical protein
MLMRRNLKVMIILRKREDYDIYERDNEEKEEKA